MMPWWNACLAHWKKMKKGSAMMIAINSTIRQLNCFQADLGATNMGRLTCAPGSTGEGEEAGAGAVIESSRDVMMLMTTTSKLYFAAFTLVASRSKMLTMYPSSFFSLTINVPSTCNSSG